MLLTRIAPVIVSALARSRPLARAATVRSLSSGADAGSVSGMVYQAAADKPTIRLFTKGGCTLCDVAKDVLARVAEDQPHTLEAVDITDTDNTIWWERYKYDIPVLHVNGVYWAKHR